jgi:hypothetical protein
VRDNIVLGDNNKIVFKSKLNLDEFKIFECRNFYIRNGRIKHGKILKDNVI